MNFARPSDSCRAGLTRREFICLTALAAGATALRQPALRRPHRLSPNEKLNIGVVGAGGKGVSDTDYCASENIVALCDVDETRAAKQLEKYPNAKFYRDWRKMLEREKTLDALIVSTPDHTHAVIVATAIRLGKHVYCQKPLTRTVYEARLLNKLAKQYKVVTQMGNQGSAEDGLRRAVEVVQSGLLGQVREVYVWSNRPIWPQGMSRPEGADPVPVHLAWDLWLGPAPVRPYKEGVYHPFNWRGWQDFGTGALGDMACHTLNMPFRALRLGYPTVIEAVYPCPNSETYPLKSIVRFEFPARGGLAPVTLWWYDGGEPKPDNPYRHDGSNKPPREVTADVERMMGEVPGSGCLLIGDKGKLFSPDDYGAKFFVKLNDEPDLVEGQKHEAVAAIPQTIPRNPFQGDADARHHLEWIAACKGGPVCYSSFDVAAQLTEIALLGCVALRLGRKIEWDAPRMRVKNAPEAAGLIRPAYRRGWTV